MASYRPSDTEFALEADTGDEELPAPSESDPAWVRRLRWPAAAVLLLLATGVTVLQLDTAPAPTAAAPTEAASTAPVEVVVEAPALVHRAAPGLISDDLDGACPATASCRTSTTLSPADTAALRAAFPDYTDPTAHTVWLRTAAGSRLLGRFLHVSTTTADVTVQVSPGHAPDSVVRTGTGASTIVVVERTTASMVVRVTVGGPAASDRPGAPALRLAADARLTTLP